MICVVEDDPNIREIEVYAMKDCGFPTVEAASAEEFWKICDSQIPKLVLLDIMLPDEDGITILKRMREQTKLKDVPVILVTAKGTEIDKVRGLDAGADDYIAKPFGILELISRGLRSYIGKYQDGCGEAQGVCRRGNGGADLQRI